MKILKSDLADKLKNMKNTVLPKTYEGMQGILVKDGQLIATNIELTIVATLEGSPTDAPFIIPQNAIAYIESLPEGEVEIKASKKYITITGGAEIGRVPINIQCEVRGTRRGTVP